MQTLNGNSMQQTESLSIVFSNDTEVYGYAGCNRMMGTYSIDNNGKVGLSQLATNRLICPGNKISMKWCKR